MKTSNLVTLVTAIAVASFLVSIYFAVSANFYTLSFIFLIAIECLGIYALIQLGGEAKRRENKTNKTNEVSQ